MEKNLKKLYILEGADGTGKSTLSREIAEATKGHVLHGSWNKEWEIPDYHRSMIDAAAELLPYQPVILDRWSTSEEVYSEAFRGGAKYSSDEFIVEELAKRGIDLETGVELIYCSNDNAIENHIQNMQVREELFDDMAPVVREYTKYLAKTALKWTIYDFNKVDMKEFVKEITQ